jgi:cytochrome b involved in lipid metabolism
MPNIKTKYYEEDGKTIEVILNDNANASKLKPLLSMNEVSKHNSPDDLWIVIEDKVYDLTNWISKHPGGHLPLHGLAGKDATEAFENFHPAYVWK